jgi:hypothetical protein
MMSAMLVGPQPENAPLANETVGVFAYAPFSKLFPRACAIVHQGGSGTTGQAMRAGRPMLIVPYAHDQPDNALRARKLNGVSATKLAGVFSRPASYWFCLPLIGHLHPKTRYALNA